MDIRDLIFERVKTKPFTAQITAERNGILSGVDAALAKAEEIGVTCVFFKTEGEEIKATEMIAEVTSVPKLIAVAEENIIGELAKYSGIATAANKAMTLAQNKIRVACGAWKKMPPEIKHGIRKAVVSGGITCRICEGDMVYLDKNYIKMLGGIENTLNAVKRFQNCEKVIQIKGDFSSIEDETRIALNGGATIIMVDTGRIEDIAQAKKAINAFAERDKIKLAYAGGVVLEDVPKYPGYGVDILCVGKEIIDAPLLDMKLDIRR